ncbi:hypothetical protein GGX14DRAFT_675297 [Mycena pura]|uniref:Uncharacterized protein n=1 Tax=Mycena pura TaxID=153505 RepID=A0AAD6VRE7_9AGAR|nr:hypothetical protein GGX14DRAFT_675297 [Mycena pura]
MPPALPIAADLAAQIPQPRVFLEGNPTLELNDDPNYAPVIDAVHKTFIHLAHSDVAPYVIASIQSRIKAQALDEGTTERRVLDAKVAVSNITDFLRDSTPCIVLRDMTDGNPSVAALQWGTVLKGDKPTAEHNIIYIEKTLAMVLCANATPPPDVQSPTFQRDSALVMLSVTVSHETIHALNKYTFGAALVTPKIGTFEDDIDNGKSEAGFTFERDFYNYRLEAIWEQSKFADANTRMWHMKLMFKNPAVTSLIDSDVDEPEYLQFNPTTVSTFIASLSTHRPMDIWAHRLTTYDFDDLSQASWLRFHSLGTAL